MCNSEERISVSDKTNKNLRIASDDSAELIEELVSDVPKLVDTDRNLGSVQDSESTLTSIVEEKLLLRPSRYNSEAS